MTLTLQQMSDFAGAIAAVTAHLLVEWSGGVPSLDQRLPSYRLLRASWQKAAKSC